MGGGVGAGMGGTGQSVAAVEVRAMHVFIRSVCVVFRLARRGTRRLLVIGVGRVTATIEHHALCRVVHAAGGVAGGVIAFNPAVV